MVRTRWARPALLDLNDIRSWIARDSPRYAEATVRGIRTATERLKRFPKSGRVVPEWSDERYRELIHRSYRIIYQHLEAEEVVMIVAVIHGSRRLPSLPEER